MSNISGESMNARLRMAEAIFVAACLASFEARGQATETLTVSSPRPVLSAAAQIEERFGIVVTYEDPKWTCPDDLKDITEEVWKGRADQPRNRVVVPRGGALAVPYETDTSGVPKDMARLVADVAAAGSVNGVTFKAWQTGQDVFHIAAIAVRDKNCDQRAFMAVLDTVVSLPMVDAQYVAARYIEDIVHQLNKLTSLVLGATGAEKFMRHSALGTETSSVAKPARDLLMEVLAGSKRKMSWNLACGPTPPPLPDCSLNLYPIERKPHR